MIRWLIQLRERFRPFRADEDINAELQAHFDELTEDGLATGLPLPEARRRARLRLGDFQAVTETIREGETGVMLEGWYRDFKLGLRSLRRSPVFAITAILTLGVGIGANTAVFTLLHGLLLRSLPVKNPAALVRIGVATATGDPSRADSVPYEMLQQLRRQQKSFTDISGWASRSVTMEANDSAPRLIATSFVSGNAFDVLGMNAYVGRLFSADDDVRGGPVGGWPMVLSYGFWKDEFGGDPSVLGRRVRLSNTSVTVVGVAAPSFRGVWPGSETKLFLPLEFFSVVSGRDISAPDSPVWCNTIGRLRRGVSLQEARAELATYQERLIIQFVPARIRDRPESRNLFLWVSSARTGLPTFFGAVYATPLYLMQGLVAIVLLLCCVNVAGLMMSKVHARRQEFAIRTAIGAARWRLIRQYLTESFVIALSGAALGAAAAWHGTRYMLPFFRHPNEGIGMSINPDSTVLVVTAFCAVLSTLLFGTLPARRVGASNPGNLLKSRTGSATRRGILGRAFIPLQVGLSFALVSIATLLSQSLTRLETEQTGFDLDHVTIQTAPFHLLNLSAEARMELYHRMKTRMEQIPGMNSVSFTLYTPMTSFQAVSSFQAASSGANPPEDPRMALNHVGPGYFRTMRTGILEGREFQDNERNRSVCVVNQSAAAYLFPRQSAIGQYVRSTNAQAFPEAVACRIVGIAQDAKFANLHEAPPRTIYFPVPVEVLRNTNLVFLLNAQTKAQAIAAYRTAKSELSPATPYVLFVTLREQMDAALGSQRALSVMSTFFAGLALFLSGLGLYGLLSASVAQRTGEIGVRMALGAERGRVLRMILSESLGLLAAGLALGAILLAATVQFVTGLLYGVSAFDPMRTIAVMAVLACVAIAAGLIPAMRAASIDPIRALRGE